MEIQVKLCLSTLFLLSSFFLLMAGCSFSDNNRKDSTSGEIPLFHYFEEISREAYEKQYGQDALLADLSLSVAQRIARVSINPLITAGGIQAEDRLSLELFDGKIYRVRVDRAAGDEVISLRGSLEGAQSGILYLSAVEEKVLATIEIAEQNLFYTLKYNRQSANHYLFECPMDLIRHLED